MCSFSSEAGQPAPPSGTDVDPASRTSLSICSGIWRPYFYAALAVAPSSIIALSRQKSENGTSINATSPNSSSPSILSAEADEMPREVRQAPTAISDQVEDVPTASKSIHSLCRLPDGAFAVSNKRALDDIITNDDATKSKKRNSTKLTVAPPRGKRNVIEPPPCVLTTTECSGWVSFKSASPSTPASIAGSKGTSVADESRSDGESGSDTGWISTEEADIDTETGDGSRDDESVKEQHGTSYTGPRNGGKPTMDLDTFPWQDWCGPGTYPFPSATGGEILHKRYTKRKSYSQATHRAGRPSSKTQNIYLAEENDWLLKLLRDNSKLKPAEYTRLFNAQFAGKENTGGGQGLKRPVRTNNSLESNLASLRRRAMALKVNNKAAEKHVKENAPIVRVGEGGVAFGDGVAPHTTETGELHSAI